MGPVATREREQALAADTSAAEVSHNLVGQRLGKKGQATRERILAAMLRLLADPDGPPVTLTLVAREAKIGLTNLYLYFPDLGELLLAALQQVMANSEEAYIEALRRRWPDEGLETACRQFLGAHFAFWQRHARLLHMRNALADASDMRVLAYRQSATQPILAMLATQMAPAGMEPDTDCTDFTTVLFTGLERTATVLTHRNYLQISGHAGMRDRAEHAERLLDAEAKIMALAIAQRRNARR